MMLELELHAIVLTQLLKETTADHHSRVVVHTWEIDCLFACVSGYMCCNSVLDKDGVSAAAIAGEMISYLATKSKSLSQQLTTIFEE